LSQLLDSLPGIRRDEAGFLRDHCKLRADFGDQPVIGGQSLKFQQHRLHSLQQRVVQIPRDSLPFGAPCLRSEFDSVSLARYDQPGAPTQEHQEGGDAASQRPRAFRPV
jgi:hypothetical protein